MAEKVDIVFSANDRDVIKAYQKQIDMQEKQIQKMREADRVSGRTNRNQKQGIESLALSAGSMISAYASVPTLMYSISAANQKVIEEAQQIGKEYDTLITKFQVQSGLKDIARDETRKRIAQVAERNSVLIEDAFPIATQLVSSGFSSDQASGNSLDAMLKILAANNAAGQENNPVELTKSLAKYLAANGLEKSDADLLRVGKQTQSLFLGTDLQLADLSSLSKKAGTIATRLSVEEQLAGQSALVSASLPSDSASEALAQIVLKLSANKDNSTTIQNLEKLGLKPDDVDLTGENLDTVLTRFKAGLQNVPEKDRNNVLKGIFGDSAVSPFGILMANQQILRDNMSRQSDSSGFDFALDSHTGGRNAGSRRFDVRRKERLLKYDNKLDLYAEGLDEVLQEQGRTPFQRTLSWAALHSLTYLTGKKPEDLIGYANYASAGMPDVDDPFIAPMVRNRVSQVQQSVSDQEQNSGRVEQAIREQTRTIQDQLKQPVKVDGTDRKTPRMPVSSSLSK